MFRTVRTFKAVARVLAGLGILTAAQALHAQDWPTRAIRIVSPYAAGGVGDTIFRIMSGPIEAKLGQRFVIDNKTGAAGNIGVSEVVRAAPDGYTFVLAPTANFSVNQFLFKQLGFDPLTQLDPVATLAEAPLIATVNSSEGIKTLKEFAAKARDKNNKLNFGSPGIGSPTHLAGASFSLANGGNMQHIAYRGTPPMLQAMLANDVQLAYPTLSPILEHLRVGKLTALAVMSKNRLPELPNVPTAAEAGFPDLLFGNWWVLAAPKGTDPKIISRFYALVHEALSDPDIRARFAQVGHQAVDLGPADTAAFTKSEAARYKSLIERTGIKLE